MKQKLFLSIFIFLSLFSFSAEDPFDIDIESIEKEFEVLDKFEENYLNNDESLHNLKANKILINKTIKLQNEFELVRRSDDAKTGIPTTLQSFLLGPIAVILEITKSELDRSPLVLIVAGGILVTAGVVVIIYASSYDYNEECIRYGGEACAEIIVEVAVEVLVEACFEACSSSSI